MKRCVTDKRLLSTPYPFISKTDKCRNGKNFLVLIVATLELEVEGQKCYVFEGQVKVDCDDPRVIFNFEDRSLLFFR